MPPDDAKQVQREGNTASFLGQNLHNEHSNGYAEGSVLSNLLQLKNNVEDMPSPGLGACIYMCTRSL